MLKVGAKVKSAYSDAKAYDIAYTGYQNDSIFYKNFCKQKKSCLYLGIGTGRIFAELAKKNFSVIGIDNSKEMIRQLRIKFPTVKKSQIIFSDILKTEFPQNRFDTIIAPHSFLTHFDTKTIELILKKINFWLKPGGSFVTDFFSPYMNPQNNNETIDWIKKTKDAQVMTKIFYNKSERFFHEYTWVKMRGKIHLIHMHLNYYFPKQINSLLKRNNFASKLWGDFKKRRFTKNSQLMVYEAVKR